MAAGFRKTGKERERERARQRQRERERRRRRRRREMEAEGRNYNNNEEGNDCEPKINYLHLSLLCLKAWGLGRALTTQTHTSTPSSQKPPSLWDFGAF